MSNITSFNATSIGDGAANGLQNASAATVLWAIITLALTATSQASYTARYCKYAGASLSSNTSAYRVSPVFCLYDTFFELCNVYKLAKRLISRRLARDVPNMQASQEIQATPSTGSSSIGQLPQDATTTAEDDAIELAPLPHDVMAVPNDDTMSSTAASPNVVSTAVHDGPTASVSFSQGIETVAEDGSNTPPVSSQHVTAIASSEAEETTQRPNDVVTALNDGVDAIESPTIDVAVQKDHPMAAAKSTPNSGTTLEAGIAADNEAWYLSLPPIGQAFYDSISPVFRFDSLEKQIAGASSETDKDILYARRLWLFIHIQAGSDKAKVPATESDLLEIIALFEARTTKIEPSRMSEVSPAIYSMKVALFVLGALPQAVKIFAIGGIPVTQTLAAVYLSAIIVHGLSDYLDAICDIHSTESDDETEPKLMFLIWMELSHWGYLSSLWDEARRWNRLPSDHALGLLWDLSWPADYTLIAILFVIVATTPFSVYSRSALSWFPWVYIGCSILTCLTESVNSHGLATSPSDWRFWYQQVCFRLQLGDRKTPLLVLSMPICIGFSQVMRWTFLHISRVESVPKDDTTHILELLKLVAKEQKSTDVVAGHLRHDRKYDTAFKEITYAVWRLVFEPIKVYVRLSRLFAGLPRDVQWTSYLLFNIMTLVMAYAVLYDGSNTVQPAWTSIFG